MSFPSQIEEMILRCKGLAPHYENRGHAAEPPGRNYDSRGSPALSLLIMPKKRAALLLAAALKDNIGISAEIRVTASGSLPRSAGKANRVKDRR